MVYFWKKAYNNWIFSANVSVNIKFAEQSKLQWQT